jgi:hypothetical protein
VDQNLISVRLNGKGLYRQYATIGNMPGISILFLLNSQKYARYIHSVYIEFTNVNYVKPKQIGCLHHFHSTKSFNRTFCFKNVYNVLHNKFVNLPSPVRLAFPQCPYSFVTTIDFNVFLSQSDFIKSFPELIRRFERKERTNHWIMSSDNYICFKSILLLILNEFFSR